MKHRDLIGKLEHGGCYLLRHGNHHDIYKNSATGLEQPVPRHQEINELLAHKILRTLTGH